MIYIYIINGLKKQARDSNVSMVEFGINAPFLLVSLFLFILLSLSIWDKTDHFVVKLTENSHKQTFHSLRFGFSIHQRIYSI